MKDKDEFLYTDIAFQLFNTFANADQFEPEENKEILNALFQSLSKDHGDNPYFMPALIYAFMVHLGVVFSEIAKANDAEISEIRSEYVQHYNENVRQVLSRSMSNKPSMHKQISALLDSDEEIEKYWEEDI